MVERQPAEQADILIVDDTPDNLHLFSHMLKEYDYTVRTAINGTLALQSILAAPPSLILLDVMMPEMDGYEVCRRVKADERTQQIPVIFLSGLGDLHSRMRAFDAGGLDFITKPFHAEEVIARIRNYLALQKSHQQLEKQNAQLQKELSERKALEKIISRTKKEWEHTFDAVPDFMFILDRDFRVVRINRAAAHHVYREPKNCIGQTCYSFCPYSKMLDDQQECTREACGEFGDSQ